MNDEQRDERQHGAAEARGPGDAAEERAENGADGAPEGAAQRVAAVDVGGMSRQELENELELARAEIERLQDQSLRRQAELVNFRRRAQKEIAESAALGQGRLLELLVPVVDDFERAVDAESEDVRAYHEGVELILRSLHKVLEQIGVERIDPRGEAFDPRYHEAIARHETDEVPDGHVLDVYQTGYRLGDRLIRPAAVVVAFGGAARSSDENADERTATTDDDDSNDG